MGNIIAQRIFAFKKRGRKPVRVVLSFGLPVKRLEPASREYWICPLRITGFSPGFRANISGFDSLQAVTLAFQLAEILLPTMAKDHGGKVEFQEHEIPLIFDKWPDLIRSPLSHKRKLIKELNVIKAGRTR